MVTENTKNNAVAKSFKSPIFLAIAICLSVVFLATLITLFTAELGILLILSVIFSGVSTLCAWLLYATPFGPKKLKNLRLYMAYKKIMTTFAIVLVSIVGAVVLIGCIVLTLMGDIIKNDIVPMLEQDVKPALEEIVENMDELGQVDVDFEEAFAEMPQEIKDLYGIQSPEQLEELINSASGLAEAALGAWDEIIDFLNNGFIVLTVIVAIAFAVIITILCLISSAYKRTSKYLKALANDINTDKKAPFVKLFIGGGLVAIGGLIMIATDFISALSAIAAGATLILFAVFFKEMNEARKEELAAPAEGFTVDEAPAIEETPVVEEAPAAEEAPAEEETSVEQ